MDSDINMPESEVSANGEEEQESNFPHDYTWKTQLCECDGLEEAWQISEVLKQAGIESWIERPGSRRYSVVPDASMEGDLQVLVAADQLDQARAIAARPIPQEIVEQSKMQAPEFEPPVCPVCGAGDPVLEDVDPFNTWKCEACGKEWTESATALKDEEKA
jgi:ribosomal protein L37AE/L43A